MASAADQIAAIGNLATAFKGTETKTKGSRTTQTKISDAGVNELIRGMLAGPGGVKTIGNAARRSGLYNSTTEEDALGDLYSSAAVKAELARSPTTESFSQTAEQPGALSGMGGALGAAMIGAQALNSLSDGAIGAAASDALGSGLSSIGSSIGSLFGMGGASAAGSTAADYSGQAMANWIAGQGASGAATQLGTAAATNAATTAGTTAAGSAAASAGAGAAAAGAGSMAANAIPLAGNVLSGFLGGKEAAKDPMNLAMSAAMGAMALGPVGLIAAPLAVVAGGLLSDVSVICSALSDRGFFTKEFHATGEAYLATLPADMRLGYWAWAIPVSKKIRAGSKFWTAACLPFVRQYIELAAMKGKRGLLAYLKRPAGTACFLLGEPLCLITGKLVKHFDRWEEGIMNELFSH